MAHIKPITSKGLMTNYAIYAIIYTQIGLVWNEYIGNTCICAYRGGVGNQWRKWRKWRTPTTEGIRAWDCWHKSATSKRAKQHKRTRQVNVCLLRLDQSPSSRGTPKSDHHSHPRRAPPVVVHSGGSRGARTSCCAPNADHGRYVHWSGDTGPLWSARVAVASRRGVTRARRLGTSGSDTGRTRCCGDWSHATRQGVPRVLLGPPPRPGGSARLSSRFCVKTIFGNQVSKKAHGQEESQKR